MNEHLMHLLAFMLLHLKYLFDQMFVKKSNSGNHKLVNIFNLTKITIFCYVRLKCYTSIHTTD